VNLLIQCSALVILLVETPF